jgi:NAD(P)-dependent dehydrogenase (short-subunit alcohol dehydrogenase family)
LRTIAVTGSASGLGAAVRGLLGDLEDRVIGVDLHRAEIEADLSTTDGRRRAVAGVREAAGGSLDGLVVSAGLGPHVEDRAGIASVNYFGAVGMLDGLRDTLAAGRDPAAVAVSSNSATGDPSIDPGLVEVFLAGDEAEARRRAPAAGGMVYGASKRALARAVRRRATEWADAGVRLNAVAPGPFDSPMMDALLDSAVRPLIEAYPIPMGRRGEVGEVAGAIVFLLSPMAAWIHGSVLFVDGGTDALLRPDVI